MRLRVPAVVVVAVTLLAPAFALAQQKAPPPVRQRVIELILDGEGIEGETSGPALERITEPPPAKHAGIIQVRQEFKAKVMASVGEM